MDPVVIVFFALAVVGSLWLTLYAAWEFHLSRQEDFAEMIRRTVHEEVHVRYLWPLLLDKVHHWVMSCEHHIADAVPDHHLQLVLCPDTRRLFCNLRRAMLLQPMEFEAFVCVCLDAVRGSAPCFTRPHCLRQSVQDECTGYVVQPGPFRELCEYLLIRDL